MKPFTLLPQSRSQAVGFLFAYALAIPLCPKIAFLQFSLAIGLVGCFGAALARLMRLPLPKTLALPTCVLYGEVSLVAYAYLRFLLTHRVYFPAVSAVELFVLILVVVGFSLKNIRAEWKLFPESLRLQPKIFFTTLSGYVLWWAAVAWFFQRKIGLLTPTSTDPDIHAFYTKALISLGELFYTIPNSNVTMTYPSGFMTLGFVWAKLSFLNAVQLVNLQPYWQYLLFVGAVAGFEFPSSKNAWISVSLTAVGIFLALFTLSPLFLDGRQFLEGTARLSHTAVLMLPFLIAYYRRPESVEVPSFGLLAMMGFCTSFASVISPAHLAPSALLLVLAVSFFEKPLRMRGLLIAGGTFFLASVIFVLVDPYYHSKLFSGTGLESSLVQVGENQKDEVQVDSVLVRELELGTLRAALKSTLHSFHTLMEEPLSVFLEVVGNSRLVRGLEGILLGLLILLFRISSDERKKKKKVGGGPFGESPLLSCGLLFVAIQFFFCLILKWGLRDEVLAGALMIQYSNQAWLQVVLLFSVLLLPSLLRVSSSVARVGMIIWLFGSMDLGVRKASGYGVLLGLSSVGGVSSSDVALAKWAEKNLGLGERVLLKPTFIQTASEDWVVPLGGGRAFALYSSVPTAFFYGIDGYEFRARDYRAHVEPSLDLKWVKSRGIRFRYVDERDPHFLPWPDKSLLVNRIGTSALYRFAE